ncbi:MAG: hypothetical protein IT381_32430 [Deltaproteobacteria bacterium]|nr:hypothetical protein [Deltaproteobacteria bacterium]
MNDGKNAQIGDLAAELSHQVNNPLAVAVACAATVERLVTELNPEHATESQRSDLVEVLGDLRHALERIRLVVRNINTLSFKHTVPPPSELLGDPFPAAQKK